MVTVNRCRVWLTHPKTECDGFERLEAEAHGRLLRVKLGSRAVRASRPNWRVGLEKHGSSGKTVSILSGAISGDQGLKCPYLAEILATDRRVSVIVGHLAGFGARTENPRVGGLIPPHATMHINAKSRRCTRTHSSWPNIPASGPAVQYFGPLLACDV